MNLKLPVLFPEQLSTTRDIEVYTACPYKWYVNRCQRMSKYTYNNDLEAGSEFAKAMETTRNAFYKDNLPEEDAINLGVKSILENFGATYANAEFKDDLKTPEKLAEVFKKMFAENPMGATSIVPFKMEDGTLSVEQDFDTELPIKHPDTGKPLILKCKLDMLGTKDNVVYVVDEKTCKSVLLDDIKQTDLLRTQNQFVQYVTVGNMNKDKFNNLEITHVRINRVKIKKTYTRNENAVVPYDFAVDVWFQRTWWDNLLFIVQEMVDRYNTVKIRQAAILNDEFVPNKVIFPRAYGNACTTYFKPCSFTYHCTSGNAQDLSEYGFRQVVCDSRTNYEEIPLVQYKAKLLGAE